MTLERYLALRGKLAELGYGDDYTWAQTVQAPTTARAFACEYVFVVLNSGMKNTVARKIMDRLWPALEAGQPAASAFGHPGKCAGIDRVWRDREDLLRAYQAAPDKLAFCLSLPWIGDITKYHLAKNLGADVAKPDRWLVRVAALTGETVDLLCQRLSAASGDRVATVDVILWRACAVGLLRPGKEACP